MKVVGSLATKLAPPFSLILHYFLGGIFFNIVSYIFLLFLKPGFPFYSFINAALIHTFLLGFVMMIIFGALYQLIPVALEIPIFSFKLGYIQFYLYITGIIIFIPSMIVSDLFSFLPIGATLIYISILIFVVNFFVSLRNLEKFNITARFLTVAVIFLTVGITIGLFLSWNFVYNFFSGNVEKLIISHILFALFGFVFMVIMGVSMVLLPMFSLAHKFNDWFSKMAFYLITTSLLVGGPLILLTGNKFIILIVVLGILISLIFYLFQVFEIYRKRPRRTPDIGIDTMFFSHVFLIIAILFGISIPAWNKAIYIFVIFLLFGFVNLLIYGSLFKIIPFLTWFHKFSELVGKKKVPMLADMLPQKIPNIQIIIHLLGLTLLTAGYFFSYHLLEITGIAFMLIASGIFTYLTFYILRYKVEE